MNIEVIKCMAENKGKILVAIIGFIAAISAAIISNWDNINTYIYNKDKSITVCPSHIALRGDLDICNVIRLGDKIYFSSNFKNENKSEIKITRIRTIFNNRFIYNDGINPHFVTDSWIKDRFGILKPNEEGRVITSDKYYHLKSRPKQRSLENITIDYDVFYKKYDGYKKYGKEFNHKTVVHLAISWCGDAQADESYGEECDPLDPMKTGFGTVGCSTRCKAVNK